MALGTLFPFPLSEAFSLADNGVPTPVLLPPGSPTVLKNAATLYAGDIRAVCGTAPEIITGESPSAGRRIELMILDGPAGVARAKACGVDMAGIAGAHEAFRVVEAKDSGLLTVIASDARGAAYGLLSLSEAAGVTPWVWWADVAPAKRATVEVTPDGRVEKPVVPWRGIFINDEDFSLVPWAKKTLAPDEPALGPKTHERIFQLMLRLRANTLWPGMHPSTTAFHAVPGNRAVAAAYGIVLGSSHCEPMLRNNVGEWKTGAKNWNYRDNGPAIRDYWRTRVDEMRDDSAEAMWTLGLRGIHDGPHAIFSAMKPVERARFMEGVLTDQRKMLEKSFGRPAATIPQVFIPYKDVRAIYDAGLRVPDDVTLVFNDNNLGWLFDLPTPAEAARAGGAGLYYHISYWGSPGSTYLWLGSVGPRQIRREMLRARDAGVTKFWMLNVGDIKPAEISEEYFLRLAWNPDDPALADPDRWIDARFVAMFGPENGAAAGALHREYLALARDCRIENQVAGKFSHEPGNDEAGARLEAVSDFERRAGALAEKIPAALADAYYELVLYNARALRFQAECRLGSERAALRARQGFASAARLWNDMAAEAWTTLDADVARFDRLAGGKWNHFMNRFPTHMSKTAPARTAVPAAERAPAILSGSESLDAALGNAVTVTLLADGEWKAMAIPAGVEVSPASGTVRGECRISVAVKDPEEVSGDVVKFPVQVSGREILVSIPWKRRGAPAPGVFVQNGPFVVAEAVHANRRSGAWKSEPGLGRRGAVLTATEPGASLEFDLETLSTGAASLVLEALPTHKAPGAAGLRVGVSLDGGPERIVDLHTAIHSPTYAAMGYDNAHREVIPVDVGKPGRHVLRLRAIDATPSIERVSLVFDPAKPGRSGPGETRVLPASGRSGR